MKKTTIVFAFVLMLFVLASCDTEFEGPIASVSSGEYSTSQTVELSCTTRKTTIYYTLDGSDPMTSGTEYTDAITITYATCIPQTCLKAVAKNGKGEFSTVSSFNYVILGPAGGYVFYDCDADNESGNADGLTSATCGWRYLEAAHDDIAKDSTTTFVFGYYRTEASGENLYMDGSTCYGGNSIATRKIGSGESNTAILVAKMGSAAYTRDSGTDITANYAARLCDECTNGNCDDWFLPSKDELNLMYNNLYCKGLGGFASDYYCSSSEDYNFSYAYYTWIQYFYNGHQYSFGRYYKVRVRAVRAF